MRKIWRGISMSLIAAASAIAFVQTSSAADLPAKAPFYKAPPPAVSSWTGFYVGANAGGGWSSHDVDYAANDAASALLFTPFTGGQPSPASFRSSGLLGGLQLGYNWQFAPTWVAGLEADFDFADVKGSGSSPATVAAGHPVTATVEERITDFGTLRARLGYLPVNNLLIYVTGGLAYANVEHSGNYVMTSGGAIGVPGPPTFVCFPGAECFNGASKSWQAGWTAGGGLEFALTPRWTVKAEYLHASFASKSITETATTVFPGSTPPLSTF